MKVRVRTWVRRVRVGHRVRGRVWVRVRHNVRFKLRVAVDLELTGNGYSLGLRRFG